MQEPDFYTSILSELADLELGSVIGKEILRRKCIGVLFFVPAKDPGGHGCFMSMAPNEYTDGKGAAEQLIMFAALAGTCKEGVGKQAWYDPEDNILSDKEPWK